MRRSVALAAAVAALSSVAFALTAGLASARYRAAVVSAGGDGVLTDPDGNAFALRWFRVHGIVANSGSAKGKIRFVWRGSFAQVWGDPACGAACDTVTLTGKVQAGSVASDGTVTLSGTAREVDERHAEVLFDSGFDEPFSIVAGGSLGQDNFILQWCLLPEFRVFGSLRIRVVNGDDGAKNRRVLARAASSPGRAGCAS